MAHWWRGCGSLDGDVVAQKMPEEVLTHWMEMSGLIGWRCGGSLVERLWLMGWRCSGSLDGDVMAHCPLDGDVVAHWWRSCGSLDGDVVANCIQMWCLIGWRFGGSLDGNVVAHGGDVMAQ